MTPEGVKFWEEGPKGMATGIGSLPHLDPVKAVGAVLSHLTEAPFWPQLPRLGPQEGMTLQYLAGFPALGMVNGSPVVDTGEEGQGELAEFYREIVEGDLEAFALPEERARGYWAFEGALKAGRANGARFLKGHVTGPVTLASSLKDRAGRELTYDDNFREVVGEHIAASALWQVERLGRFGKDVIIFLDEPGMEVFGSAFSSLDGEMVLKLWQPALDKIAHAGALSGIHCCGNTDWTLLLQSDADIINFDAYQYLERLALYPLAVSNFLERGGVLAWGIVPSDERAEGETTDSLLEKLEKGMELFVSRGVDAALLRRRSIITPSCGMGSLQIGLSERVLELVADVCLKFRERHFP